MDRRYRVPSYTFAVWTAVSNKQLPARKMAASPSIISLRGFMKQRRWPMVYTESHTAFVDITPGAQVRADLALQAIATTPAQDAAAPPPSATTPVAPAATRGFFTRLGHAYLDDWTVDSNGAPASPAPARRGTPAPLNSPPFPAADWPIGGTVGIGAPDYNTYPLMQAINENKSRIKIYGWFDIGGNASTSNKGRYANNETAYDVIPNSFQLDQAALYFERLPNTVQQDHIDWGFRFVSLYGLDYRYTTAKGIFSQQLLARNDTYGYDAVMYYLDLYLPHAAKGMDVRIGRYISLPDIEAQLAPNNYTYSHSILYTYDCYTQHGINTTTKLSDHWTVQAGISAGCESAPWISNAKLTGNACAAYTWKNGGDNLYACANSINSGKYAYNNLAAYYLTYYHKINETWHTDTEAWYQYEKRRAKFMFRAEFLYQLRFQCQHRGQRRWHYRTVTYYWGQWRAV